MKNSFRAQRPSLAYEAHNLLQLLQDDIENVVDWLSYYDYAELKRLVHFLYILPRTPELTILRELVVDAFRIKGLIRGSRPYTVDQCAAWYFRRGNLYQIGGFMEGLTVPARARLSKRKAYRFISRKYRLRFLRICNSIEKERIWDN